MASNGHCSPRFERVHEEFERNFAERGELGASLCVWHDGEKVVDLWGGIADPTSGREWDADTIQVLMSCSKGVTATCAHLLVDQGLLDLESPVSRYWPEFGQHGKRDILVRQILTHQSGVAHVDGQVPAGGFNDWDLMVKMLEETAPFWDPGTRVGYHGLAYGWLIGELVRRITGMTIGSFLREQVTEPLGLDLWLGLPAEHESRVAPSLVTTDASIDALPPRLIAALKDPNSLILRTTSNMGGWIAGWDTPEAHAAEIPAGGAIGNARSLAGMYAPLSVGGTLDGVRLASNVALARMRNAYSWTDLDAVLCIRTCYTMGFAKSWPNPGPGNGVIIGEDAFGTPGIGGQIGFADPACRLAFAYTMNQHGPGAGLNERGQSLIDATYQILGSPTSEPGFWLTPAR